MEMEKQLRGQFVTLAIDGGKVHKKLMSMSVICNKKAYYLTSSPVLHNDHETILKVWNICWGRKDNSFLGIGERKGVD